MSTRPARCQWPLLLAITLLLASGCTRQPDASGASTSIGPYSNFSGRLIVIEPERRWQVMLQWHADRADRGEVRLTHAATGTVVEFRWFGRRMQIRGNHSHLWKTVSVDELAAQGLVIPPQQLASILLGRMPSHYIEKKTDFWESRNSGSPIRLQWRASSQKLTMTDIKHGRQATLLILP